MTEVDPLLQLTAIIQDVGIWAVFLYLFINERTAHNITRDKHMEDLREIAGMKPPLGRLGGNTDK